MNPIRKFFAQAKAALTGILFPGRRSRWVDVVFGRSRRDYSTVRGTDNSIVVATLLWIMRSFPGAPLMLKETKKDGTTEQHHLHPMLNLIENPNPYYSGILLWMATLLSYNSDGNAYWVKLRTRGRIPVQVLYIPHFMIEPVGDENNYLTHYEYRPGGSKVVRLEREDVVHFRFGIDPENIRKGIAPLRSVLREVMTDDEAANYTMSILFNMGLPGLVLTPKGGSDLPTPDELKATKDFLMQNFTGDHRGEPLVGGVPMDVTVFGYAPEQMNLGAIRNIPEERITAVLGVPAAVVGLGTGLQQTTVGATLEQLEQQAYRNNLIPTQRLFAADLKTQLLVDFEDSIDGFALEWDLSNIQVMQEDQTAIMERAARALAAGGITVKDFKQMIGREATDEDDYYLRPLNVIAVPRADVLQQNTAPAPALLRAAGASALVAKTAGRKDTTPAPELLMRQFARDAARLETLMVADLARDFAILGERAASAARSRIRTSALAATGANASNGHRKVLDFDDPAVIEGIMADMDFDGWDRTDLEPHYHGHYSRAWLLTTDTVSAHLGIDLGIGLNDPIAVQFIADGGTRRGLLDIPGETRRALFRAFAEARENGLGPEETARLIRQHVTVGRFSGVLAARGEQAALQTRARVIARTETLNAQRASSLLAYEASDIVTGVLAFDNGSGYDDADCVARNGTVYTFDEARSEMGREHPSGTLNFAPITADN